MAVTYLVDAHNALHRLLREVTADIDARRRRLVDLVRRALPSPSARGHLVFDADPKAVRAGTSGRDGGVSWEYARGSADEAIVEWLRREERPRAEVVVVTDDRELRGRARQLGARVETLGEFFPTRPEAPPASGAAEPRRLPPLAPEDFGLPRTPVELHDLDPDDLGPDDRRNA